MNREEYDKINDAKAWCVMETEQVLSALGSNTKTGLAECYTTSRQDLFGKNEFEEAEEVSIIDKILHHLKEVSSIILLVAAAIAAYMAFVSGEGWMKVSVILSIVIINVFIGIRQENSAEKALEALKGMTASKTNVLRDGIKQSLDITELVPGDVLLLVAGDIVPADARVVECSNLQVDESFLTGESLPVEKHSEALVGTNIEVADQTNMVFSGAPITRGNCVAVVCATAMNSEMGAIASMLNSTEKTTTLLQTRLATLAKRLCIVAVVAAVIIFILKIFVVQETLLNSLMIGVSLAVAAVPETLPVIVTITLAYGIKSLVKRNAIVRRISAVETTGNVSVICSDKTGTLTQNKMTVVRSWAEESAFKKLNRKLSFETPEDAIATLMVLANNASVEEVDGEWVEIGDPTELSLLRFGAERNITHYTLNDKYPRVEEHPFESSRKLMTTIHKVGEEYLVITKGAFDRFPGLCTEEQQIENQRIHDAFGAEALRVLAVGFKWIKTMPKNINWERIEKDMVFLGIVGMIDPPREEAKTSVALATEAGIRTVMITGDHLETAKAIAAEIGIYNEFEDMAISGATLHEMSQEDFEANIRNYCVYARVSPEDKIRIVQAWQKAGEVVVMTGDGVNDAPALKAADVGAAMGITGTDVSKNIADIILTDDNYATIVEAVSVGRRIYDNIRKTVYFLLSVNFAQIFIMLLAVIFGWNVPLVAVQILLINVVADGIPGFYISRERADPDIMRRPPTKITDSLFSNWLGVRIGIQSFLFTVVTLFGFAVGRFFSVSGVIEESYEVGMTMAFLILGISSVLNVFNVRSNRVFYKIPFKENPALVISSAVSILIIIIIATTSFTQSVFLLTPLGPLHWIISLLLSVVPLAAQTGIKLLAKKGPPEIKIDFKKLKFR